MSHASTDKVETPGKVRLGWQQFRQWRRQRPFWAGLFTLLSALILLYPPYASLQFGDAVISLRTLGGISATVIGIVMVICGVSLWIRPQFRTAAGIVTLLLALVAIVTANLGSFLIGTLLGLIGAALALSWSPKPPEKSKRSKRTKRRDDSASEPETDSDEWETTRLQAVTTRGGDA